MRNLFPPAEVSRRFIGAVLVRLRLTGLAVLVVAPVVVLASYAFATSIDPLPVEYPIFGPAGADILRGNWGSVFDDPAVQAGPFQLIMYAIPWLAGTSSTGEWLLFYSVNTAALALVFGFSVSATLRLRPGYSALSVTVGAIVVGLFANFIPLAVFLGHPSQVVIPAMWALAALAARQNRFVLAAIVVALSAGWEMWGVLGAPVIFLAANPRLVKAAIAGVATLTVVYGPFLLAGDFAVFELAWPIRPATLIGLLFPGLEVFPWGLRVLQALLALSAGVAAALLTRRSPSSVWMVLIAIIGVRLLADPLVSGYYWIAAAIAALGLVAMCVYDKKWFTAAFGAGLCVISWIQPPQPVVVTLAYVALTVAVVLFDRRK
jgi:hypothetical protein